MSEDNRAERTVKLPALKELVDERKEKAIENLSTSYSKNKLPLEEYERLVEYINKIESERELVVVEKIVGEYAIEPSEEKSKEADVYDDDDDYHPVYDTQQPFAGSNLTVLSTRTFSGPIKSGVQFVSILGSEKIIVRRADLGKKKTVLNVLSVLGDSVVCVEPGIRVRNKAIAILGNVDINQKVERQAQSGDPEIIISGAALLGNISVLPLKEKDRN